MQESHVVNLVVEPWVGEDRVLKWRVTLRVDSEPRKWVCVTYREAMDLASEQMKLLTSEAAGSEG